MLKRLVNPSTQLNHFASLLKLTPSRSEHIVSGRRLLHSSASHFRAQVVTRSRNIIAMSSDYLTQKGQPFDRAAFESLLRRKTFLWQSFEPYGAVKGLFDYGPPLEGLESHVINVWRDHFIRTEKMMALKCSMLTPYEVLKTSGHVERFADFMCKDPKTGEILRTDHLIKDVLETRLRGDKEARGEKVEEKEEDPKKKKKSKAVKGVVKLDDQVRDKYEYILATLDDLTGEGMGQCIKEHDIRNPTTNNEVEPPVAVNLMFQTQIGAAGNAPAFLRPETAQGQFLSFQKLLEFSDGQLPFASASIGYSFRNELSPRAGLLRVREFLMGEIEHFVDPQGGKKHPKFSSVANVKLPLLSRATQSSGSTKPEMVAIGDAVASKLVDNETLGYFLVRINQFMEKIGIDMNKLRFRQHLENEMAHYASDCWDCELLNSYGWTECVGCADRSAFDLSVHEKATGQPLRAREQLKEPYVVEEWVPVLDKKKSGPKFKKDAKAVEGALEELTQELREKLAVSMDKDGSVDLAVEGVAGGKVELTREIVQFEKQKRHVTFREFVPNVIEPSFGIGRILYSLMEHSYWTRENDEARSVLSFNPVVAPIKVLICPLQKDTKFLPLITRLEARLDAKQIPYRVDQTGVSIGKRYARNDELGIPFGLTIDYPSLDDDTFTLRDRDSTRQVRAHEDEVVRAIARMCKGKETWGEVVKRLPAFEGQEKEGEE